jgi:hypothetical protein
MSDEEDILSENLVIWGMKDNKLSKGEFWFQTTYLDVRSVTLAILPRQRHRREHAVGMVKLPALQVQEQRREGLLEVKTGRRSISLSTRSRSKNT